MMNNELTEEQMTEIVKDEKLDDLRDEDREDAY